MKKIFLGAAMLSALVACDKKPDYAVISGKASNPAGAELVLLEEEGELVKEITINADGTFRDTIRNIEQNQFFLFNKAQREGIPLFLKNGTDLLIEFDGSLEQSKLTGKDSELSNYLIQSKKLMNEKINSKFLEIFTKTPTEYKLYMRNLFDSIKQDIDSKKLDKDFTQIRKKSMDYTYLLFLTQYQSNNMYATRQPALVELPSDFLEEVEKVNYDNAEDFKNISSYRQLVASHFFKGLGEPNVENISPVLEKIKALKSENIKAELSEELVSFIEPNSSVNELVYNFVKDNVKDTKILEEATQQFEAAKKLSVGQMAPSFAYENYNGGITKLEDLKGKVVYIDVWATWCGPCRQEIPFLKELEKEFHNQPIEFVSISIDEQENKETWRQFVEREELKGVQLIATNGWNSKLVKDYLIKGIPRFILVDKEGKIIDVDAPRPSFPETKELLKSLIK